MHPILPAFLSRFTFSRLPISRATACCLTALLAMSLLGATPARAEVRVGLSDWPGWVAWYVAEQKGFFKKHGAQVKLVWFANYTDSIAALSAGQLDANSQTWSDTLPPLAKGIPLKAILVNDNSAGNDALMVSPKIGSFADLKGKSVALEQFSVSHFVLATALAKNNLRMQDVKVVNLPAGDAAAAFLTGRVDAAVVWNPWVAKIEASGKGRALFSSRDMPGLIPDLLVAHAKAIGDKKKRTELVGVVRAWFDTEAFIRSNPAEAAQIMAKVVGLNTDEYKVFLPGTRFFGVADNQLALDPAKPQSLVSAGPTIHTFLAANKLIEGQVNYANGVDSSLLRDALNK